MRYILELVCSECEDKTPMLYEVDETERDAQELECWVCQGVAKRSSYATV
jgi:hypothetical protein